MKCKNCDDDLLSKPTESDQGRGGSTTEDGFCSLKCSYVFYDIPLEVECISCSATMHMDDGGFCSTSCHTDYHSCS